MLICGVTESGIKCHILLFNVDLLGRGHGPSLKRLGNSPNVTNCEDKGYCLSNVCFGVRLPRVFRGMNQNFLTCSIISSLKLCIFDDVCIICLLSLSLCAYHLSPIATPSLKFFLF